jgi:hypothetical protein
MGPALIAMTSIRSLITVPVDLKPNPLPYGRMLLQAGASDQMRAKRAYHDGDEPPRAAPGTIDKRV